MEVQDVQSKLIDHCSILGSVKAIYWNGESSDSTFPVGLAFIFEELVFQLVANDEDQLIASIGRAMEPISNCEFIDVSRKTFWTEFIGMELVWAWRMINNFGYFDGFQMEFRGGVSDSTKRIQVVALGSELKLYSVDLAR